jgi:AcrR family transcriptional regulator
VGKGTKERILTEGVDLLSRNRFAGVTLGVLSQKTGMSKSGLFAHFKSKDPVQLELLEAATIILVFIKAIFYEERRCAFSE